MHKYNKKNVYFILGDVMIYLYGIKGSGMSALACLLDDLEYEVEGIDTEEYIAYQDELIKRKIKIHPFSYDEFNYDNLFIIGNAFLGNEKISMIEEKALWYSYSGFLNLLFSCPKIGVSGTHGKTTTTTFLTNMIDDDISYIIGDGTGYGLKKSNYFILEACEYKNTFLKYDLSSLIITNIDYDHPDFFNSIDDVIDSFQRRVNNVNLVILNGDCANCRQLKVSNGCYVGFNDDNDVCLDYEFPYIILSKEIDAKIYFPYSQKELIIDYALGYVLAYLMEIKVKTKPSYRLPKRRLQKINDDPIVYTDYAHHPIEIKVSFNYFKNKYPDKKIILVFEFHTISRIEAFYNEFMDAFKLFDDVYLTDIFTSVREENRLQNNDFLLLKKYEILKFEVKLDEIVIFMGAGKADRYAYEYVSFINTK